MSDTAVREFLDELCQVANSATLTLAPLSTFEQLPCSSGADSGVTAASSRSGVVSPPHSSNSSPPHQLSVSPFVCPSGGCPPVFTSVPSVPCPPPPLSCRLSCRFCFTAPRPSPSLRTILGWWQPSVLVAVAVTEWIDLSVLCVVCCVSCVFVLPTRFLASPTVRVECCCCLCDSLCHRARMQ